MALTYKIKDFTTVGDDILVGFDVTDDSDGQNFFIDEWVGKTLSATANLGDIKSINEIAGFLAKIHKFPT